MVLPQLRMPPWRSPLEVFFLKFKKTLVVVVVGFSLTVLWDFCHQGWTCLNVLNEYDLTSEQWKKVIFYYRKTCTGFLCRHSPLAASTFISSPVSLFWWALCHFDNALLFTSWRLTLVFSLESVTESSPRNYYLQSGSIYYLGALRPHALLGIVSLPTVRQLQISVLFIIAGNLMRGH